MSEQHAGITESTIARMAGTIAAGLVSKSDLKGSGALGADALADWMRSVIMLSAGLARGIAKELAHTAPTGPIQTTQLRSPAARETPRPKAPQASAKVLHARGVKVLGIVKRPRMDGGEAFIISTDDGKTYHTGILDEARFAKAAKDAALTIDIGYRPTDAGVREIAYLRQDVPAAEAKP